jgi:hypothetical protein
MHLVKEENGIAILANSDQRIHKAIKHVIYVCTQHTDEYSNLRKPRYFKKKHILAYFREIG